MLVDIHRMSRYYIHRCSMYKFVWVTVVWMKDSKDCCLQGKGRIDEGFYNCCVGMIPMSIVLWIVV